MFEFQIFIFGLVDQGVFVDSEMVVIVCLFLICLRVLKLNGIEMLFYLFIEFKGRLSFCVSFIKDLLYVGCLFLVYKLKIISDKMNQFKVICMVKIDLKEDFDCFWVDEKENRIVVVMQEKILIFIFLFIYNV